MSSVDNDTRNIYTSTSQFVYSLHKNVVCFQKLIKSFSHLAIQHTPSAATSDQVSDAFMIISFTCSPWGQGDIAGVGFLCAPFLGNKTCYLTAL